jgi:hypothetical protein
MRAGVPSRFGGNRYADYPAYLEPAGPPVAASLALAATDAATVRLSRRAMQNWARVEPQRTGRTGLPLAALETGLRAALAAAVSDGTTSTHAGSGVHEVEHGALTWLLTGDCTGVIGARTPRGDADPASGC